VKEQISIGSLTRTQSASAISRVLEKSMFTNLENGGNAIDNCHETGTDGAEKGLNLES
jgi:hypothetical protein